MDQLLPKFLTLLRERSETVGFASEDELRYTLFAAILFDGRYRHFDIGLERKHTGQGFECCEVDMFLRPAAGGEPVILECKYDKKAALGSAAVTARAGRIFNDFARLSLFPSDLPLRRYFVYLTDTTMHGYLQRKFAEIYESTAATPAEVDETVVARLCPTAKKQVRGQHARYTVAVICSGELPNQHFARVFEVTTR